MALVAMVVGIVATVLTQTQIGRDQVAKQIEGQFSRQFEGSLSIGKLSGNLLWDLYASDVVIRDGEGRVVLSTDSLVLEPRWRSLLSNNLEVRRVRLYRPLVDLVYDEGRGWNLATAFASRRAPGAESGGRVDLDAAEIRVVDGTFRTQNAGELPAAVREGALFDFTNSRATSVTGRFVLRLDRHAHRLRVRDLVAHLPDQHVSIDRFRARLAVVDGTVEADGVELRLGRSEVVGAFRTIRGEAPQVTITRSILVGHEVLRLLPGYPLAESVVSVQARGSLSDLEVVRLEVKSGGSSVRASGHVSGLPDSIRFALDFTDLDARASDLRAAIPGTLPPGAEFGRLTGSATMTGGATWSEHVYLHADGRVDLRSRAGSVRGRVGLSSAHGSPVRYAVDADVRGLDLARFTGDPGLASYLSGRITAAATAARLNDLDGTLRLALEPSSMFGRQLQSARAELTARGGTFAGTATVDTDGSLDVEGSVDLIRRSGDVTLHARSFGLQSLMPGLPHTALTGTAAVSASGSRLDDLFADLSIALDGSTVTLADSVWLLPDEPLAVSLRPQDVGGSRLRIESDAVVIDASGAFDWDRLLAAGTYWSERFSDATALHLLPTLKGDPEAPARGSAETDPIAEQALTVHVTALKANALRPWIEHLEPGTAITLSALLSSEHVAADVAIATEALGVGRTAFNGSQARVHVAASAEGDLLDQLSFELDARVSHLAIGSGPPMDATVAARYDRAARSLAVESSALRLTDSLAAGANARLAVLEDRYRLLGDFSLDAPGEQWRVDDGEVDLFTDGFVFRLFEARRLAPVEQEQPTLRLAGTASARETDMLNVQGHSLDLNEVLRLFGLELPFDGIASADLNIKAVLGQPAVLGIATIEEFAIWGDPAGQVTATSEIVSGRDGFDVDIRISPSDENARIRNDGRIAGSLRLPGRMPDGSRDSGYFDLELDLARLDLFILDHLFPDVVARSGGGATGSGTITGDWSFPLFDADLHVSEGRARVPDFNLELAAEGRVTVDRLGIHLHEVALRDKSGGSGVVDGGILFNEYRFFSFDLGARLREFEVIDVDRARAGTLPFYGHIRASGSATLTGPIDNVFLRSPDAVTTPDSRIFIPVTAVAPAADAGFLVVTDADGSVPEPEVRRSLIGERPHSERPFLEGLEMMLNVQAPSGSTVHLVFDPVIGDVINAVGSANLQLAIIEDQFRTYGTFEVERGDFLFTAGEVFTRRFDLERGGTIEWTGDPIDAALDLPASYRTRASLAGLGIGAGEERQRVPFIVNLHVDGRVTAPLVDLSLELDETAGRSMPLAEALRRRLNEPDRQAEYATSVLLTNTFLLAPSDRPLTEAADDLFYTSLSELVSARLNLFLNQALGADNIDVAVGVQQGTGIQEFDLTYGVALRLLDERLIIRGEGIYHQLENAPVADALQGELAVEMRLSNAVSIEVFYRREGDLLLGSGVVGVPIGAYGAGVNYQTEFANWQRLLQRLFAVEPRAADEAAETSSTVVVSSSD